MPRFGEFLVGNTGDIFTIKYSIRVPVRVNFFFHGMVIIKELEFLNLLKFTEKSHLIIIIIHGNENVCENHGDGGGGSQHDWRVLIMPHL